MLSSEAPNLLINFFNVLDLPHPKNGINSIGFNAPKVFQPKISRNLQGCWLIKSNMKSREYGIVPVILLIQSKRHDRKNP